jgi:hypothetical protein
MLKILIARPKEDGKVEGLIPHLGDGGYRFCGMPMIKSFLWSTILRKHLI